MRTCTAAVTAALLLAALTACSGSDAEPQPVKTVTTTPSSSPSVDKAAAAASCADAVAAVAKAAAGEVPFEPTPAPCAPLSDSEYLDAYMDGIHAASRDVLEERRREREAEASKDTTPN